MLIVRHLKLTSPLLAARHNNDRENPKRIFDRLKDIPSGEPRDSKLIYLVSYLERWKWAFLEARDELMRSDAAFEEVSTGAIIPCHWYSVKRTSTYNRRFRRGRKPCTDKFEALPTGQVFEMKFTLSKQVPPEMDGAGRFPQAPDEQQFDAMISHIGEHLGMSHWGQDYLYGRFVLHQPKAKTDNQESTKQQ